MARPRSNTALLAREGHSVSLKVLRLSRPSLAQQIPLPHDNTAGIAHQASLAYPSPSTDQDFIISSTLTLPPAFGSAYVGETFSCALCANNELNSESTSKSVSGIRLTAEIQTPSQNLPLELDAASGQSGDPVQSLPGSSVQRIVHFPLREEGNHTLTVGVSYTETTQSDSSALATVATSGRVRTFRKMYQFIAQPCVSVRTKATELARATQPLCYVLEAQVENVSDSRIVFEHANVIPRPPFRIRPLNGSLHEGSTDAGNTDLLSPRDILQLAFLVEQDPDTTAGVEQMKANLKQDGRIVLGQIALNWRSPMGEKGYLNTGDLLSRRRQT